MKTADKPSLKTAELARIHSQRQSGIIATLLQEFPSTIPPHCLSLLQHAPESFDDLRYGAVAAAIYNLHLNHRPVSILTVQEELLRSRRNLQEVSEIGQVLNLSAAGALPPGILAWECEELWNAYSFRRKATLYHEASEAMIAEPAQADSIDKHVRRALLDLDLKRNGDGLPEIVDSSQLINANLPTPKLLIDNLLHQASKMSLGGGSKTFKSWTMLNIAVSVATGSPWIDLETERAKVLIVNFEIADCWMRNRLKTICAARGLYPEPGWLDFWNLRGHSAPHAVVIPKIISRAKSLGYGLIIIDPSYKLIGQGDENSSSDVAAMMNSFELISVETLAAVLFGAHFAKGNHSAKEAIDRISGSGVFARDPDTILTFTPHEQPNCFTVEATLRNIKPMPAFVVEWDFPCFKKQPALDPANLKKRPGRPSTISPNDLLNLLNDAPLTSQNWQKAAEIEFNLSRTSFFRIKQELSQKGSVLRSNISGLWTPVCKT